MLDTNILIHREAAAVIRDDIGDLFRWLDRIRTQKCDHPHSIEEIRKHQDTSSYGQWLVTCRRLHRSDNRT